MAAPLPPCPARFNMAAYVLRHARTTPDKVALAVLSPTGTERISYARLSAMVLGVGTRLREAGLRPGDRVLLRLGNDLHFPIAYLGAIAAGIVPVVTSPALTPPEVDTIARAANVSAVLQSDEVSAPSLSGLKVIPASDLTDTANAAPLEPILGDPNRLAYIVPTSGTSGQPKLVAHAHRAVWARQMMWDDWYGLTPDDRLLHAGAFNWTFTMGTGLMDPWAIGATALIPAPGVGLEALPLLLKRHDATLFAAAPGVIRKLLRQPLALPKLRRGLCAGERLTPSLRTDWETATGTELLDAFGMTECSTFLSTRPGTRAMLPQTGRDVRLTDAVTLAIAATDPGLMLGYVDGTGLDLPLQGGWFDTGDLFTVDAAGWHHAGRSDDLLNPGGIRISPQEVEAAFDDLAPLAVTTQTSPSGSTYLVALYEGDATEPALRERAEALLADHKRPRAYRRVEALPRTPTGKLDRRALPNLWNSLCPA
ncbi:MAG: class I adenylate-forming enzyme family protein [Shimia sp.]